MTKQFKMSSCWKYIEKLKWYFDREEGNYYPYLPALGYGLGRRHNFIVSFRYKRSSRILLTIDYECTFIFKFQKTKNVSLVFGIQTCTTAVELVTLLNRASHLSSATASFSLTISAALVPLAGVGVGPVFQKKSDTNTIILDSLIAIV